MFYSILFFVAVFFLVLMARVGIDALTDRKDRKSQIPLEHKVVAYENFLMQLGAGDVGNPELEARLLLDEQRRKELH